MMNDVKIGTSGLVLRQRKSDFPAAFAKFSRLKFYSTLFNSIEINSSFYQLHKPATTARWSDEVDDDFRFTFKLWRQITHAKELEYDPGDIKKFMTMLRIDARKQGCLLVQFPASIDSSYSYKVFRLLDSLAALCGSSQWKIALEFRHASWYSDQTMALCEEHNATAVLHDMPPSQLLTPFYRADVIYIRFHGSGGKYRGSYDNVILDEYAHRIRDWRQSGQQVYVYFNNTLGAAYENALDLTQKTK